MEKSKAWRRTKYPPDVVQRARQRALESASPDRLQNTYSRNVEVGAESWRYDSDEEFFAAYRPDSVTGASYFIAGGGWQFTVYLERSQEADVTRVTFQADDRDIIEAVFNVFEDAAPHAGLLDPSPSRPIIFIGHGRSDQWRQLKDHLHEQHGYDVEAYEVGARAGHTMRDVLEDVFTKSSFALLVLTGEDEDAEGNLHARENVIHETGLFQGRLGWPRAIVVLENGAVEFSNIHGIQQLRFDPTTSVPSSGTC